MNTNQSHFLPFLSIIILLVACVNILSLTPTHQVSVHDFPDILNMQLDMEALDFVAGKKGAASASGLVPVTSKHSAELLPDDFISWNIDFKQMGLGGDTS